MTKEARKLQAEIIDDLNNFDDGEGFVLVLLANSRPKGLIAKPEDEEDFMETRRYFSELADVYAFVCKLKKLKKLGEVPFYYVEAAPNPGEYWRVPLDKKHTGIPKRAKIPKWVKDYEAVLNVQVYNGKRDKAYEDYFKNPNAETEKKLHNAGGVVSEVLEGL